ncbi:hypothetical protein ABK040_007726 [Willaertia magna]
MKQYLLLLFALLFVTTLIIDGVACSDIDFYRIRLLDYNPTLNHWLFRGNEPLTKTNGKTTFAYDKIKEYLPKVAKSNDYKSNLTLPNDYYLIDISFLTDIIEHERNDLKVEEAFFRDYPQLGKFIHWQILGSILNATDVPEILRKEIALHEKSWDKIDHLAKRVELLHDYVWKGYPDNSINKPIVIYIHCEAGMDRTGGKVL